MIIINKSCTYQYGMLQILAIHASTNMGAQILHNKDFIAHDRFKFTIEFFRPYYQILIWVDTNYPYNDSIPRQDTSSGIMFMESPFNQKINYIHSFLAIKSSMHWKIMPSVFVYYVTGILEWANKFPSFFFRKTRMYKKKYNLVISYVIYNL